MFEFFIALFGGIFYGGKYLNEKHRANVITGREKESREFQKPITASDDIVNSVKEEFKNNRWLMLESISKELEVVYGDNWRNNSFFLQPYIEWYNGWGYTKYLNGRSKFLNPWVVALHIYLSTQGLIPNGTYGYEIHHMQESERQTIIRACMIIEKNIQSVAPDAKILCVPMNYDRPHKNMMSLEWKHSLPLSEWEINNNPHVTTLW